MRPTRTRPHAAHRAGRGGGGLKTAALQGKLALEHAVRHDREHHRRVHIRARKVRSLSQSARMVPAAHDGPSIGPAGPRSSVQTPTPNASSSTRTRTDARHVGDICRDEHKAGDAGRLCSLNGSHVGGAVHLHGTARHGTPHFARAVHRPRAHMLGFVAPGQLHGPVPLLLHQAGRTIRTRSPNQCTPRVPLPSPHTHTHIHKMILPR